MRKHKCKQVTIIVRDKNFSKLVGELKRFEGLCVRIDWIDATHYSGEVKG